MNGIRDRVYLVDVDGTVAKMHNRGPFEWAKVEQDLPNWPVIEIVQALAQQHGFTGHNIIFMSGRMDDCREGTDGWLRKYVLDEFRGLYMRASGDFRPDFEVKRELYETHVAPFCDVQACFDDNEPVVDLWRSLGLTCLQVAPGPKKKVSSDAAR